jgi:hypothetical protein
MIDNAPAADTLKVISQVMLEAALADGMTLTS